LRRNPVFAAAAVVTLALGIGANAAIFSVVHGVFLQALPTAAATGLVRLRQDARGESTRPTSLLRPSRSPTTPPATTRSRAWRSTTDVVRAARRPSPSASRPASSRRTSSTCLASSRSSAGRSGPVKTPRGRSRCSSSPSITGCAPGAGIAGSWGGLSG
jgi:hypothetical protein